MPVSKKLPPLPDQHGYVIEGSRFSFVWYGFFVSLMAALKEMREVTDISDWESPVAVTGATHTVDTYEKDIVCHHVGESERHPCEDDHGERGGFIGGERHAIAGRRGRDGDAPGDRRRLGALREQRGRLDQDGGKLRRITCQSSEATLQALRARFSHPCFGKPGCKTRSM